MATACNFETLCVILKVNELNAIRFYQTLVLMIFLLT